MAIWDGAIKNLQWAGGPPRSPAELEQAQLQPLGELVAVLAALRAQYPELQHNETTANCARYRVWLPPDTPDKSGVSITFYLAIRPSATFLAAHCGSLADSPVQSIGLQVQAAEPTTAIPGLQAWCVAQGWTLLAVPSGHGPVELINLD